MAKTVDDNPAQKERKFGTAERDVIALGIAASAIILFVGTGGTVMPQIFRAWMGVGEAPDMLLTNAVLLNIALLIFGWRRYDELSKEITVRRNAEQQARTLAETDSLTGCLNRRSGGPAVDALMLKARELKHEVVIFVIDLDNFKQINDLNGHKMGDRVLHHIADRVHTALPSGSVLARIGGDEFVCSFIHQPGDRAKIEQAATAVMDAISSPIEENRLLVEASGSLGIASTEYHRDGDMWPNTETLIHRADIAMYHAKNNGRNRNSWFEPQLEDEFRFRNEMESAIRRGIPNGEFVPFYEQQIDLETGNLSGFEMLARWQSPRYGLVGPDVFIPIAEEIDLIADMSESLIRQGLRDARDWDPKLTLSVNISPLQLRDPWFAQKLVHMLVESGFPASRLEIEITESCLHENVAAVRAIVSSLKNQGIRICLDDFGTGYSSLSQLRSLPFDRLKIDRSFVAELSKDGGTAHLVEAIVSLGKSLSLPVTAEGIENPEVLHTLRSMGQLKGQGYLYGRPENAADTRVRLSNLGLLAVIRDGDNKPTLAITSEMRKAG